MIDVAVKDEFAIRACTRAHTNTHTVRKDLPKERFGSPTAAATAAAAGFMKAMQACGNRGDDGDKDHSEAFTRAAATSLQELKT